jgi:ribosomal protein S18 acetylase RimI-like enzyme
MILETTPQQEAAVEFYRATGFTEQGRSTIGRFELVWFRRAL